MSATPLQSSAPIAHALNAEADHLMAVVAGAFVARWRHVLEEAHLDVAHLDLLAFGAVVIAEDGSAVVLEPADTWPGRWTAIDAERVRALAEAR